ncbi:MAG TPA: hypothetical protein VM818_11585 [Vicinamibacterales bacterium]|nr:hypothetical protein [Vicinamibacterales bacterium]
MLHVTNGQATLQGFRAGNIPGACLAWEDPLHDGPVVAAPSLEALSRVRAQVLAGFGWGSLDVLDREFVERDRALARFRDHDETVLWFEHDLYDQLQLIQLLEWFSGHDLGGLRLSIIQIGEHPSAGSEHSFSAANSATTRPFYGLGQLGGGQLAALLPTRVPITAEHFEAGRQAWRAFCAPEPMALVDLAGATLPAMPYLASALRRLLEEYFSVTNGLSRIEQQLLESAACICSEQRCAGDGSTAKGRSRCAHRITRNVDACGILRMPRAHVPREFPRRHGTVVCGRFRGPDTRSAQRVGVDPAWP